MSSIKATFAGVSAAVGSSVALLLGGMTSVANADPAPPLPIDALQAPGLSAVQGNRPAVHQAPPHPANPAAAVKAAAAGFSRQSAAPAGFQNRSAAGGP